MSAFVQIQLTEQAQKIVRSFQTLPPRLVAAVARGMDQGNQFAMRAIQQDHLTGRGPFPPEEHKLGVVTSRLRSSVNASPAVVAENKVSSSIGSNVVYAAIHEFGGRISHPPRTMKLRHRLDARGALLRNAGHKNLAVFAGRDHKRVRETEAQAKGYEQEMPERAPFRTGIKESDHSYKREISAALVNEWMKMNQS